MMKAQIRDDKRGLKVFEKSSILFKIKKGEDFNRKKGRLKTESLKLKGNKWL